MAGPSLRVEHRRTEDLLGIGQPAPRLSWITTTEVLGWRQAGYEIEIATPGDGPWSSGRIESAESVLVPWPTEPLGSRQRRSIRVRVWGTDDTGLGGTGGTEPSGWSEPVTIETGLLDAADWQARFVTPDWDDDRPPWLRAPTYAADLADARRAATDDDHHHDDQQQEQAR